MRPSKKNKDKRVIALTETRLKESKNSDTEFMHHHRLRQDRKEKKGDKEAEENPDHLSKSGGALLLNSNEIPIELVEKASNGNVEYLIAESRPIKTAIILIYNPPSNFSLPKSKEAIAKVNKYLASKKRKNHTKSY